MPPQNNAVKAGVVVCAFIVSFESMQYKPYYDGGHVATACAGHIQDIDMKRIYTRPECYKFLDADVLTATRAVDRLVTVTLNENEKVAWISFVFNIGSGAFARSTARRLLNEGQHSAACHQMPLWCNIKGNKSRGLARRRAAEMSKCLEPMPQEGVNSV